MTTEDAVSTRLVRITLADGSVQTLSSGTRAIDLVEPDEWPADHGPVVARINGELRDLMTPLTEDATVALMTFNDPEGRQVYWHSTAHIMAHAVKDLFPGSRLGIGPPLEDGFFYDIDIPSGLSADDLPRIENRMREIIASDRPFVRSVPKRNEARQRFGALGEDFKLEILDDISDGDVASIYEEGDFVDLCRGPHVPSTGIIGHPKLLSIAAAYWRGDERNPQLKRLYGISFPLEVELEEHLEKLEEAKKRDHRVLGRELDLFSIHPDAGPGLIFWHPKGAIVRTAIEDFWRKEHQKRGYSLVYTPHIVHDQLYRTSGHTEKFRDMMFAPMDIDGISYWLKPMNCPGHIKIFQTHLRSYRELPVRLAELGTVYRYERSGVLQGMLRVRGFTQDDSHVFCTPEQVLDEVVGVIDLVDFMMRTFGYEYRVDLATRPEVSIGSDEVWETATHTLREALESRELPYRVDVGGGVFYGPKLDFKLVDALGREWQGPTIQADFNLPERFDATYVGTDGRPHRVVMIHRTVLGSMERFVGGLIEHYAGAFPSWLAPLQAVIIPVTSRQLVYGEQVAASLREEDFRAEVDARSETLGAKIREASTQKVPYMLIVGEKEEKAGAVAVRQRGAGDLGPMPLATFAERLREEVYGPNAKTR